MGGNNTAIDIIVGKLNTIINHIILLEIKVAKMDVTTQTSLDNLAKKVQAETDAVSAAQTAFTGLVAEILKLKDGQSDPAVIAAIDAAAAIVDTNNVKLSAAIPANTDAPVVTPSV